MGVLIIYLEDILLLEQCLSIHTTRNEGKPIMGYYPIDDEVENTAYASGGGGGVKSFSLGYSRRPAIAFVRANDEQKEDEEKKKASSGTAVASFYKDLVLQDSKITPAAEKLSICSVCGIEIQDPVRHHLNSAHLTALANPQAPLAPLSIHPSSTGYQYLLKHGWSPYESKGLGAEGREGSRTPLKVHMKNDKVGIKHNSTLILNGKNEAKPPQKLICTATEAEKEEAAEKRKRKRIHQDLYGNPQLNEYLGL